MITRLEWNLRGRCEGEGLPPSGRERSPHRGQEGSVWVQVRAWEAIFPASGPCTCLFLSPVLVPVLHVRSVSGVCRSECRKSWPGVWGQRKASGTFRAACALAHLSPPVCGPLLPVLI